MRRKASVHLLWNELVAKQCVILVMTGTGADSWLWQVIPRSPWDMYHMALWLSADYHTHVVQPTFRKYKQLKLPCQPSLQTVNQIWNFLYLGFIFRGIYPQNTQLFIMYTEGYVSQYLVPAMWQSTYSNMQCDSRKLWFSVKIGQRFERSQGQFYIACLRHLLAFILGSWPMLSNKIRLIVFCDL